VARLQTAQESEFDMVLAQCHHFRARARELNSSQHQDDKRLREAAKDGITQITYRLQNHLQHLVKSDPARAANAAESLGAWAQGRTANPPGHDLSARTTQTNHTETAGNNGAVKQETRAQHRRDEEDSTNGSESSVNDSLLEEIRGLVRLY
jgi:hypothetical protein